MSSAFFSLLSLFALFATSFSMLAEPVLELLVDSPVHQCADTDSDTDDDDDDSEDDSLMAASFLLASSLIVESRVTLLSDATTSSRNLAGDPRGPPVGAALAV